MTETILNDTKILTGRFRASIAVSYAGWETGSDAALRDELKRIRDTGFSAVRVRFNRDNDIEKGLGMLNWRNPDRFFDSAERVGLGIFAEPGNAPHHSVRRPYDAGTGWNDTERESVLAWIKRFCRQYRGHSALQAWIYRDDLSRDALVDDPSGLLSDRVVACKAFQEADPDHSLITISVPGSYGGLLAYDRFQIKADQIEAPVLCGTTLSLDDDTDEADGEFDRPLFAIATSLVASAPAGSQAVIASCTGGNMRYTATYPVTFDSGLMTRLLLLLLASGLKSVCLDTWRPQKTIAAKDQAPGNSGMLDWLDRVTPSTAMAGKIAQAVETYHAELERGHNGARVQILLTESADKFASSQDMGDLALVDLFHGRIKSRLGSVRTLLNGNIPFSFVTEERLLDPTEPTAPILFIPEGEVLSAPLLARLKALAESGTRIVADMPCGWLDENYHLLNTAPGSPFEQLFGVRIAGIHAFPDPGAQKTDIKRYQHRAQLVTTTAKSVGGSDEIPAFVENRVGKGRALLINLSLSRLCYSPDLHNAQLSLLSYLLGSRQTSLPAIQGCLTFRLSTATAEAEHIFLINDQPEDRTIEISVSSPFTQVEDLLTRTTITVENSKATVTVPASSGTWLRCTS